MGDNILIGRYMVPKQFVNLGGLANRKYYLTNWNIIELQEICGISFYENMNNKTEECKDVVSLQRIPRPSLLLDLTIPNSMIIFENTNVVFICIKSTIAVGGYLFKIFLLNKFYLIGEKNDHSISYD